MSHVTYILVPYLHIDVEAFAPGDGEAMMPSPHPNDSLLI